MKDIYFVDKITYINMETHLPFHDLTIGVGGVVGATGG
jgi:hypothetical protein